MRKKWVGFILGWMGWLGASWAMDPEQIQKQPTSVQQVNHFLSGQITGLSPVYDPHSGTVQFGIKHSTYIKTIQTLHSLFSELPDSVFKQHRSKVISTCLFAHYPSLFESAS